MRDILPDGLIELIRDRYLAGVSDAQEKFSFSKGDEDALTGALGHSISMAKPMAYSANGQSFKYQITYQKIRGRGPGAPDIISEQMVYLRLRYSTKTASR